MYKYSVLWFRIVTDFDLVLMYVNINCSDGTNATTTE